MRDSVTVCAVLFQGVEVPAHSTGIFTPEWADRLYRGIRRHTTRPFRFVLFVDRDDYEFKEPIETRRLALPFRNCLSLLEPFRENFGRVVFMGLDTVIVGNIDPLMDYRGPFAMLRDPYVPERMCSGVMAFPYTPQVWERVLEWNHAGILDRPYGADGFENCPSDMAVLNTFDPVALDDHVSGIYSYKAHIHDDGIPIEKARVVYFHGDRKPHQLSGIEWVDREWGPKIPVPIEFINALNNDLGTMLAQVRQNMTRDVPWLWIPKQTERKPRAAVICGGGPSIADSLPSIAYAKQSGTGDVFALNGAHDYLIGKGLMPDYMVMLDSRQENAQFVRSPRQAVKYLINAACHPSVFDALRGFDATLWFCDMDGIHDLVRGVEGRPVVLIGGGATVGLKTMAMCYLMGYRHFEFHGFDSCYRDTDNHAYRQPMNDGETVVDIVCAGRTFRSALWMAKQAKEFQYWARFLFENGCTLTVHGDGLIAHIMRTWKTQSEIKNAS